MQNELKVRVSCPICGQLVQAKSLDGHLKKVHELTGLVTLRLHPTRPYTHEPEAEVVELTPPEGREEGKEAEAATTPKAKAEAEAAEAEAAESKGKK